MEEFAVGAAIDMSRYRMLALLAIAGVFVALLFPVMSEVRDRARGAVCASNLGQLVQGMCRYAADHEGLFPPPMNAERHSGLFADLPQGMNSWHAYLIPYIGYDWTVGDEWIELFHNDEITSRSDAKELTLFNCPAAVEELSSLPEWSDGHLDPWWHYGLNADLPWMALGVPRRAGVNVTVDDLLYPAETMAILETWDWSAMWHREIAGGMLTHARSR